jgi:hypothetical protein
MQLAVRLLAFGATNPSAGVASQARVGAFQIADYTVSKVGIRKELRGAVSDG